MAQYIFAYHKSDRRFVENYRVLSPDQTNADIEDIAQLTGTVHKADAEKLFDDLCERFPSPTYDVAKSYANKWDAVKNNFAGMRNHES